MLDESDWEMVCETELDEINLAKSFAEVCRVVKLSHLKILSH